MILGSIHRKTTNKKIQERHTWVFASTIEYYSVVRLDLTVLHYQCKTKIHNSSLYLLTVYVRY